jgi:transposase
MEKGKFSVGVDLHKSQFTVCVLDSLGERQLEEIYYINNSGYEKFKLTMHEFEQEFGCEIELAVETTGNARYFKNQMEAEGFVVLVVNTNKFKVISQSTKKNDRNDASTLAYYLYKEMLPESYLADQSSEELRRMLKSRSLLVSTVVKLKNQIHGMMLGYGITTKGGQLQSKKKRQSLLCDLEDHGHSEAAASLKVILQSIEAIEVQIKELEKRLSEMTKEDEDVELLMSIPGVGPLTATTIAAYTKDIEKRFEGDFKRFASYIGIVPSVHSSNEVVRMGRITKRGPQELRTALVQATLGMIRLSKKTGDWKLMTDYKTMKVSKGSGVSIIATTRKLARIIFAMLNNREPFKTELMVRSKSLFTVDEDSNTLKQLALRKKSSIVLRNGIL